MHLCPFHDAPPPLQRVCHILSHDLFDPASLSNARKSGFPSTMFLELVKRDRPPASLFSFYQGRFGRCLVIDTAPPPKALPLFSPLEFCYRTTPPPPSQTPHTPPNPNNLLPDLPSLGISTPIYSFATMRSGRCFPSSPTITRLGMILPIENPSPDDQLHDFLNNKFSQLLVPNM